MHPKLMNAAALAGVSAGVAALALGMSADLGSQPYGQHGAERLSKPRPKKKRKFKGSRAAKRGHPR